MLSITGKDFDVDSFVIKSGLSGTTKYKGESRFRAKPEGKKLEYSIFSLIVSDAEFSEFNKQIDDVRIFLKEESMKLIHIKNFIGIEYAVLDFGVRYDEELQAQSFFLPPDLISSVAAFGLSIELSLYTYDD